MHEEELISDHGSAKIYRANDNRKLLLKRNNILWALGSEIRDYKKNIGENAKGDCLEIGLGLGVASKHILSFSEVKSLTTIEMDYDVIQAQKQAIFIDDSRHIIINTDGLSYINETERTFDFIFFDFYKRIDNDNYSEISKIVQAAQKILNHNGIISGWIYKTTPKEFKNIFTEGHNNGANS